MREKPSRILAIRLSAVGDVINTLPSIAALRAGLPGAEIGFLVEDRAHAVVAGHPLIDRVHLYPRRRWTYMALNPLCWPALVLEFTRYLSELRRPRYEAVLDFQANFKGAAHAVLTGTRRRIGFSHDHCKEWDFFFNNEHVTPPNGGRVNRVVKFLSLAVHVGARPGEAAYVLPEAASSRACVEAYLAREGISGYLVIHPGTSHFGRAKRWQPERFSSLVRRIGEELGLRSVVTWGPGERSLAESIVRDGGRHAALGPETGSLLDLAEIIRRACLFVGCDSAPLHLSSAVGVPSVALFGPKDPDIYGPFNPLRRIVKKASGPDSEAMTAITVEDAFAAVADLLAEISA
jgi:ADP-heptose:LPS heptosyltransferase